MITMCARIVFHASCRDVALDQLPLWQAQLPPGSPPAPTPAAPPPLAAAIVRLESPTVANCCQLIQFAAAQSRRFAKID